MDRSIWKDGDIGSTEKRGISISGSSSNNRFENLVVYNTGPDATRESQDQHGVKLSLGPTSTGNHVFKNIRIYDAGEDDVQTESVGFPPAGQIATFEDFVFGQTPAGTTDSGVENSFDFKATGRITFRRGLVDGRGNRDEVFIDHGQKGGSITMESVTLISNGTKRGMRIQGIDAVIDRCWFQVPGRAALAVGGNGGSVLVKNTVFENTSGVGSDGGVVQVNGSTHCIESSTIVSSAGVPLVWQDTDESTTLDQCFLWSKNQPQLFVGAVKDGATVPNHKRSGLSISDLFPLSGSDPFDPIKQSAIHDVVKGGIRTDEFLGRVSHGLQSYGAYDP